MKEDDTLFSYLIRVLYQPALTLTCTNGNNYSPLDRGYVFMASGKGNKKARRDKNNRKTGESQSSRNSTTGDFSIENIISEVSEHGSSGIRRVSRLKKKK